MKCVRCNGSGLEPDNKRVADSMRRERVESGMSQRRFAGLMRVSPGYLCQLEQGTRRWTQDLRARFLKVRGEMP